MCRLLSLSDTYNKYCLFLEYRVHNKSIGGLQAISHSFSRHRSQSIISNKLSTPSILRRRQHDMNKVKL